MRCKNIVRELRTRQGRLRELRTATDQGHTNLMSYQQLQEARTNTQSAADIRLFTYVTIIFLPLSFTSSLFSMGGSPKASTVYTMIPTTAIALILTFGLLANLRTMDRHWRFWLNKAKARTREKMNDTNDWKKISDQLEETLRRREFRSHFEDPPLAESSWLYINFWLSQSVERIRNSASDGLHTREFGSETSFRRTFELMSRLMSITVCFVVLIFYFLATLSLTLFVCSG